MTAKSPISVAQNRRWLRRKRKELSLTQKEMSDLMGVSYGTYVQWERGRRRVPGIVRTTVTLIEEKYKPSIPA